jgi:hypothetical protein
MADSTTNLPTLSVNQSQKEVVQNAINDAMSPASYWARDFRTTGGLVWGHLGGVIFSFGSPAGYIRRPNGTVLLTANDTNYVEVDIEGLVTVNTVGFTPGQTALYEVITGAANVITYFDVRLGTSAGGSGSGNAPILLNATWVVGSGTLNTPVNDVHVRCPVSGTVTAVSIGTIGGTGACVVDIWKDTHANYPPTVADTICGGNKPTISAGVVDLDVSLTGWTTGVTAGDWFVFHLDSTGGFQAIFVQLYIQSA